MSRQLYGNNSGLIAAEDGLYQVAPLVKWVEDYEHNDEAIWSSDGSGTFEVTNNGTGNYFGRLVDVQRVWSHPSWGSLDHYPQAGDHFEFVTNIQQWDGQTRFYYGRNDTDGFTYDEHYSLQYYSDGTFRLVDGNGYNIAETYSSGLSADTDYKFEFWWEHPDYTADHRIIVREYVGDGEYSDPVVEIQGDNDQMVRSSGGVMKYTNSGSEYYIDDIKINDRTQ